MKSIWIVVAALCAAAVGAQSENWEATAEQQCIPDLRPADDGIDLQGSVLDAVLDNELTLAIDGDADGRGDRLLRLRPENALDLPVLRDLAAGTRRFEFFRRDGAAPTVRLIPFGSRSESWLVLRSSDCPPPEAWLEDRDIIPLASLTWIRTPDGPPLGVDDPPEANALARAYSLSGRGGPSACQAGGPGALACGLSDGEAGCFAGCPAPGSYACCTPTACGCERPADSD